MPCAAFRPSPLMSVSKTSNAARVCLAVMANSLAWRMAFCVSLPALAKPTTFAPEFWACSRNEAKSDAFRGCLAVPTTLPPADFTTAVVSASSALPNA
ncbi:hypothetical protein D3C87_1866900 [compost metagenome]